MYNSSVPNTLRVRQHRSTAHTHFSTREAYTAPMFPTPHTPLRVPRVPRLGWGRGVAAHPTKQQSGECGPQRSGGLQPLSRLEWKHSYLQQAREHVVHSSHVDQHWLVVDEHYAPREAYTAPMFPTPHTPLRVPRVPRLDRETREQLRSVPNTS